jgi:phosphoadenosine phosphosulfate reductase
LHQAQTISISNSRMDFGEQWNKELEEKSPQEIIQWAASKFGNLYQSTAFGPNGMVIMSMINQRNQPKRKEVNLLFIDTLYR